MNARHILLTLGGSLVTACMALPAQAQVTYSLPEGAGLFRLWSSPGATPENLSSALDALSSGGGDRWVNVSPDGQWLLVESERFDAACVGWPCLAVVRADLSAASLLARGAPFHADGFGAVANGGSRAVWPAGGGGNTIDLWYSWNDGAGWTPPVVLTGASPWAHNAQPAFSADGSRVLFDCGSQPYGQAGTAICEVGVDATGFRTVLTPQQGPGGTAANALHHPDYAPDGSIVFEADWDGEQIWRLAPGSTLPTRISSTFNNDNSPCVLSDGSIASLWLDRPGAAGDHELKLMAANGSSHRMLLQATDILDGGIGCGATTQDEVFRNGFESG